MRRLRLGLAGIAAMLMVAACGGGTSGGGGGNGATDATGATGAPVQGGTARVLMVVDPRSLDPAAMTNAQAANAFLGNALFGTLVTADPATGEIKPSLTTWTTEDKGATWNVAVKPGVTFSDGSPFNAEAVKYNLDRARDPKVGSAYRATAAYIDTFEVVDDLHLRLKLVAPHASFPSGLTSSSLNWVASPAALEKGRESFDGNPVGAGPFVLGEWQRGATMTLNRNPKYHDAPKPYLDSITISLAPDTTQRVNTVVSGGADLAIGSDTNGTERARKSGLVVHAQDISGSNMLLMNMTRPPFDDVRAREALSKAIDMNALNAAVYDGHGQPADSFFGPASPFASGVHLHTYDRTRAQALLDELAAAGKPLSFTISTGSAAAGAKVVEAVQAQLRTYKNVDVKVRVLDPTGALSEMLAKNYDVFNSGTTFVDPETSLWTFFHGTSSFNPNGIDDEAVNKALEIGRQNADPATRKTGYDQLQQRFNEIYPVVPTFRPDSTVYTSRNVGGVSLYGLGSLLPEELWIKK
ncbi:ABC transporter substrate-binding protein [Acrocarpospora catenulata]|uniref:ABC transporter substrate-binding protein n=1 Tax=Acrocarpospora catenulata TaxID=2836182 RepID=UPI001BDA88A5|nr:ABC transporter substrate-binding protein [Acrocarpospora catenulata]